MSNQKAIDIIMEMATNLNISPYSEEGEALRMAMEVLKEQSNE